MSKSIITSEDAKKLQEMKLLYDEIQSTYKILISKTNEIENITARTLVKACLVPIGIVIKYISSEIKKKENL